ncbi:hypothetical protein QKU48_gp0775 [Fadolivirus algeromassiliense]|jgi:hypothetical protein|uniref:Uncharacterized protein n=1 Tax=Fadolivirus FV1/VV64 TaxID=3070911 RepID=A0A7D3UR09_9VIRU|nr:hypothetical protein QKU48_gp0775 [Fadolivirus algeromassiliense]QKF94233.1 hypothetical protein Fadolivirus_1_775 [Fadolivirus FV1/VV64]
MTNLINSDIIYTNRILVNPSFTDIANEEVSLKDIVILYNNGKEWKVIPLYVMQMYPIIHDKYYQINKNDIQLENNITIYMCPYTLYSSVYFSKLIPFNKLYNNNLTLLDEDDKNILLIPITNTYLSLSNNIIINKYTRKNDVKIMTLRNAITNYPDCRFINTTQINKIDPLVTENYINDNKILFHHNHYSNKYNSKQLIHIIEYISKKQDKYKYTIIIPKNNNIDITKNGLGEYFNKMIGDIRDKGGIIYPCFWFAWNGIHPNTKIIAL